MRKRGFRIITERALLSRVDSERLLTAYKKKNHLTWKTVAQQFGVSEFTVREVWRKGKASVPLFVYRAITSDDVPCELLRSPFWGQSKGGLSTYNSTSKPFSIPLVVSSSFAELYGALLGDGCIPLNSNSLTLTGNVKSDSWYMGVYLRDVIEELFGISPKIYSTKNTIRVVLTHKELPVFFSKVGYFSGTKLYHPPCIPKFLTLPDVCTFVLRGMLDTDGGVYSHPHSKIMVGITSKHVQIRKQMHELITNLGYSKGLTSTGVQFYGSTAVTFLRQIGTSNPRNIHRFTHFILFGRVPSANETERYLTGLVSSCTMGP